MLQRLVARFKMHTVWSRIEPHTNTNIISRNHERASLALTGVVLNVKVFACIIGHFYLVASNQTLDRRTGNFFLQNVDISFIVYGFIGPFHFLSAPPPPYWGTGIFVGERGSLKALSEGVSKSAPFSLNKSWRGSVSALWSSFLMGVKSLLFREGEI